MDRMSPQDATMLHIEDDRDPMHIGNVLIFEGPPPRYSEFAAAVAAHLDDVPRYRQRIRQLPLQLGRPVWVDDEDFDIRNHVRPAELRAPGDDRALRRLAGDLFGRRIDRTHPLWEMWFVRGLSGGRWAVVCKTHHSMADGVAGTAILATLLDTDPDAPRPRRLPWHASPPPGTLPLLVHTAEDSASYPLVHLAEIGGAAAHPRSAIEHASAVAAGAAGWAARIFRPSAPGLNTRIVGARHLGWASTTLDALRPIRAAFGVTVNDLVLAAETRGFRDLLRTRGARVEGRVVRSLMPVSVRSSREADAVNNRVSAYFVDLPIGVADPVERLRAVQAEMGQLKRTSQAAAADALMQLAGWLPAPLHALGCRVLTEWPQGWVNTVTTNVPGPQTPLYACGRRMLAGYPYVPLWGTIQASVAVFSYCGRLDFGVSGDARLAELEVLTAGITAGLDELTALAKRPAQRRARPRRRAAAAVGA